MNNLREISREPQFLSKKGFLKREQDTNDSTRWVWHEKILDSYESPIRFVVQVEFELVISDAPFASYLDNLSYYFNGVRIVVVDKQMERWDDMPYDEMAELPCEIDRRELNIHTLGRLKSFCEMLGETNWGVEQEDVA